MVWPAMAVLLGVLAGGGVVPGGHDRVAFAEGQGEVVGRGDAEPDDELGHLGQGAGTGAGGVGPASSWVSGASMPMMV